VIYDPLLISYGFIVAVIPIIILFILIGLYLYFPLTGFFGGWDKDSVERFEKVVLMSGPSKWLVSPMFSITKFFIRISPLHDKFGMESKEALQEARELYIKKQSHFTT
jgi:hypothetical protein